MNPRGAAALVTGGGSGLGLAAARRLAAAGALVTIADVADPSDGDAANAVVKGARFVTADVTKREEVRAAVAEAGAEAPLRILVHTAGRGGPLRILDKTWQATPLEDFRRVVETNLVGTYNVLQQAAEAMAATEPVDGERGVAVLTASIAAWEGRVGQVHYASSKAGIVGLTLTAARDLASKLIRVSTIAPGTFDTPMLARLPQQAREELAAAVPHPSRLGSPEEFAALAVQIVENPMINGETIRLDGGLRMSR